MKGKWIIAGVGLLGLAALCGVVVDGCTTINAKPDGAELARERQSSQWSQGTCNFRRMAVFCRQGNHTGEARCA
jgi:hypothetical protein